MTEALHERRRHRTEREIRAAALTLFEERGVDGTTVDDIAREAGVSPRTVFRYAATKERAALIPEPDVERQVDHALAALDPTARLVPQLERLWRDVLATFEDGRSEAGREALRLWRLVPREPRLLLAALAVDEERLARTQAALVERLELDPLTTRVVLESTGAVVRVALDRWAGDPDGPGLVPTYDAACEALRRHAG
ncbi:MULTISPECIES: TetR/AcrR family transcriptional regulator [unclassified Nocardioides]|uniref:TetR/AcrR family transcriptional regulator n=1 Tax=unclassified Nocardioides TaxID=2615069 RepID=UPI0030157E30